MGNSSRKKGHREERALVRAAKSEGLDAERAWNSNGESLGRHEETDIVIEGYGIQVKRQKKILPKALKDEGGDRFDLAVARADREQAYAVVPYKEFLSMLKEIKLLKEDAD